MEKEEEKEDREVEEEDGGWSVQVLGGGEENSATTSPALFLSSTVAKFGVKHAAYTVVRLDGHGEPTAVAWHLERLLYSCKRIWEGWRSWDVEAQTLEQTNTKRMLDVLLHVLAKTSRVPNVMRTVVVVVKDRKVWVAAAEHATPSSLVEKRGEELAATVTVAAGPPGSGPRPCPNVKDASWVADRERLDALKKAEQLTEVILVDENNRLLEGLVTNFFVLYKGELWTAPNDAVLKGLMRRTLLLWCKKFQINVRFECPRVEDCLHWEAALLTSAARPCSFVDVFKFRSSPDAPWETVQVPSRASSVATDLRDAMWEQWG